MLTRGPTILGVLAAALVAAGALAPLVSANGTDTEIAVSVSDACPGERERCFALEEGTLGELEDGHGVRLVLENTDDQPHTVHVATLADADRDRQATPANASFASTDRVPAGEQGVLAFAPPSHAEGVYLWDALDDQEARGLWLAVPYDGEPEGLAEAQPAGLPMAAVLAGLAAAALAARNVQSDG